MRESDTNFDVEKYLLVCEQLGQEPDPTKMPLEISEFPPEVQVAFFMLSLLPGRWEGMSGTYMGKIWDGIDFYFDTYQIEDRTTVLYFMKSYERHIVEHRADKAEAERKRSERQKSGGKNYTYNVKG